MGILTNPYSFGAVEPFTNTISLDFDGADDRLIMGDVTILDGSNTFTISAWVKLDSLPGSSGRYVIVSKDNAYELYIGNSEDYIYAYLRLNNGAVNDTGAITFNADTWYHLAAVHNSGGTDIYLDGTAVGTGLGSQVTINDAASSLAIGARWTTTYPTDGHVDEVAIFDAALDSSDISAIYNSGVPTDLSEDGNLVGYWRMGDGATYPTILDESSNSNDGTMTNMAEEDIVEDVPSGD